LHAIRVAWLPKEPSVRRGRRGRVGAVVDVELDDVVEPAPVLEAAHAADDSPGWQ
jgi:hypothetical protein